MQAPTLTNDPALGGRQGESDQPAAAGFAVLLVFWGAAFRDLLIEAPLTALRDPEAVHILLAPFLAAALLWCRRDALRHSMWRGSFAGVALAAAAIVAYVTPIWPLSLAGWLRLLPMVALAGIMAGCFGWRTLGVCFAPLMLVALAIPLNSPFYPYFMIAKIPSSLEVVNIAVNLLPGVHAGLSTTDLIYTYADRSGVVEFDNARSSATLMLSVFSIGLFIGALRPRGATRWVAATALGVLVAGVCGLVYQLSWAVLAVMGVLESDGRAVRLGASIVALVLAYLSFWLLWTVIGQRGDATCEAVTQASEALPA